MHCHPTVRLWSRSLLDGEPVRSYSGDPLLDFSISNFLDRIAYKDPKSKEKLAKFARTCKMADSERPINDYDFSKGEKPAINRLEEEYLYKYLTKRPKKEKAEDGDDSDISAFAEQEIMNKMKQMKGQPDQHSEDDLELSEGDFTDDPNQEGEEDAEMEMDQGAESGEEEGSDGFFGGQDDLESVNMDQDEEEDENEDYGEEYDEEIEEQERA